VDRKIHFRKQLRLKDFDYSSYNSYFITICTHNRKNYFGSIANGEMILNNPGRIIQDKWLWLESKYQYVQLDEYIVMPNHFHGILSIIEPVNGHDRSLQKIKSVSSLIGAFKTITSKEIHLKFDKEFKWQKSFYDRIIRSDKEFENIQSYIYYNPLKWELDIEISRSKNVSERDKYYENIFNGK